MVCIAQDKTGTDVLVWLLNTATSCGNWRHSEHCLFSRRAELSADSDILLEGSHSRKSGARLGRRALGSTARGAVTRKWGEWLFGSQTKA